MSNEERPKSAHTGSATVTDQHTIDRVRRTVRIAVSNLSTTGLLHLAEMLNVYGIEIDNAGGVTAAVIGKRIEGAIIKQIHRASVVPTNDGFPYYGRVKKIAPYGKKAKRERGGPW